MSVPCWTLDAFNQLLRRCGLLIKLADHVLKLYRAEIIKIEHPTRGDDTRAWGPPYAEYEQESPQKGPGESAYFLAVSIKSAVEAAVLLG